VGSCKDVSNGGEDAVTELAELLTTEQCARQWHKSGTLELPM